MQVKCDSCVTQEASQHLLPEAITILFSVIMTIFIITSLTLAPKTEKRVDSDCRMRCLSEKEELPRRFWKALEDSQPASAQRLCEVTVSGPRGSDGGLSMLSLQVFVWTPACLLCEP